MRILLLMTFLLSTGINSWAQEEMTYRFKDRDQYSVSQAELEEAVTFLDVHYQYHADWVETFISTEVIVKEDEETTSAAGMNDTINAEQKCILQKAPVGSDVILLVKYMPRNNLKHNTEKEMDYIYKVVPYESASFTKGEKALDTYIEENLISKLSEKQKILLKFSRIDFTVTQEGNIINSKIIESSGDEKIDSILMETICKMPKWNPAINSEKINISQDIQFMISNSKGGCLMNLGRRN